MNSDLPKQSEIDILRDGEWRNNTCVYERALKYK